LRPAVGDVIVDVGATVSVDADAATSPACKFAAAPSGRRRD
jgi:hypothetical protein